MSARYFTIRQQLRHNFVALVSLFIAVCSLGYTSWRHELTEENHNYRVASFEILLKLGELQELVFYRHYDRELVKGNPRAGWAYVLTIRDLSALLPGTVPESTEQLVEDWGENWQGMGLQQASADAIPRAIDDTRDETLDLIRSLD